MYHKSEKTNIVDLRTIVAARPVISFKVRAVESSSKSSVKASVVILKDTITSEFDCQDIVKVYETESVRLSVSSGGFLVARNAILPFQWVRMCQLAKGIHESNTILEQIGGRLRVRVVKTIDKDSDVFLWFSEDIAALMRIHFLRLENIQGQYHYRCHECHKLFENPNPLKLHIATNCENYSVDILYQRLNDALHRIEPTPMITTITPTLPAQSYSGAFRSVCHPLLPQSNAGMAAASHLETIVSNMGTSKDGHICIYCGKLYSRKYGLKIHIRTHTGFKPLKCKYCFRPFGDPSNLNKHLRLHAQSGVTHKCNLCNKVMMRKRDLERHNQTRHGFPSISGLEVDSTTSEEDIEITCDS